MTHHRTGPRQQSYDEALAHGPTAFKMKVKKDVFELSVEQVRKALALFVKFDHHRSGRINKNDFTSAVCVYPILFTACAARMEM